MNLSTYKGFTHKAKDYTSFYNENNEPRVNVEGVVQVANTDGEPLDSFGGGGGAGGGSIVYSNASGDFIATITNGTKNITITGLPFTLETINILGGGVKVVHSDNTVDDIAITGKSVSVSGGVITLSEADDFVTGDVVLVTLIGPDKWYDRTLDTAKTVVQNPNYGHYTSVETLVNETNLLGYKATADAGGSGTLLIDADGAFSVANIAVGYVAYQTTAGQTATISSVDSATNITTTTLTGAATWAATAYSLPQVKRYEINMEGYNFMSLHYRLRSLTLCNAYMTIWGTLDSAATVDADTGWVNLSASLLGSATGIAVPTSTTAIVEDILIVDTATTMLKYMVKLVVESSSASPNTNSYIVYVKKSS